MNFLLCKCGRYLDIWFFLWPRSEISDFANCDKGLTFQILHLFIWKRADLSHFTSGDDGLRFQIRLCKLQRGAQISDLAVTTGCDFRLHKFWRQAEIWDFVNLDYGLNFQTWLLRASVCYYIINSQISYQVCKSRQRRFPTFSGVRMMRGYFFLDFDEGVRFLALII